jgi:hypothetical protein
MKSVPLEIQGYLEALHQRYRIDRAILLGSGVISALSHYRMETLMRHVNSAAVARGRRSSKMRWGFAIIASTSMIFATSSATAAPPVEQQTAEVFRFDGGSTDGGTATLTRTNNGVTMRMSTTVGGVKYALPFFPPQSPTDPGLGESWEVGDATTNWFVVFNNPGECTDSCGEDDIIDGHPISEPEVPGGPAGVSIHYAAGHVAGSLSWHSAGSLREGDTSGMLFGLPLQDAMTAEVHLVARSHGPMADIPPGSERGLALNSLNGGCPPNGPNVCGDAQAAVFALPS